MLKLATQKIFDSQSRKLIANLKRTIKLVWDCGPHWTIASIALLVIQGILPLGALYLLKLIVDAVTENVQASPSSADFQSIGWLIAALGGIALLGAIVGILNGFVRRAQAQAVSDKMQSLLLQKAVEVDLEYFEDSQYYDTFQRAQTQANWRPREIINTLLQIGQNGISLAAMIGLLIWLHWGVVCVLLVSILPQIFVRLRYADKFFHWQRSRTADERKAGYLNWVLTRDFYAKEIRLFQLGQLFKNWFDEIRVRLRDERLAIDMKKSIAEIFSQGTVVLAIFGMYGFLVFETVQGILTVGDLVMYFQAIQRGVDYLKSVSGGFTHLYENSLFLSQVYDFFAVKPVVLEPTHPRPVPRSLKQGLVFDQVSFSYPNCPGNVLHDVSFTIKPGEHIALVGENGAGKSTLIKLLCRLYNPTQGRISLDGIDLSEFTTADLRRQISVVFQDFARYQFTARTNVWVGDIALSPQSDLIPLAAEQAGAADCIKRLPLGYDNMLGRWFEGGGELSLGEWQKVALARAFVRNSPLIVLDEPSSALDAKSEFELFERFHELTKGRTAILISHRFSTVKMVDRIYVLDGGGIAESGSHDELVEQNGEYAKLFALQAHYYR